MADAAPASPVPPEIDAGLALPIAKRAPWLASKRDDRSALDAVLRFDPDATRMFGPLGRSDRVVIVTDARAVEAESAAIVANQPYRRATCTPAERAQRGCGDRGVALTIEAAGAMPIARLRPFLSSSSGRVLVACLYGGIRHALPFTFVKDDARKGAIVLSATSTVQALVDALADRDAGADDPAVRIE